ncbi:MAG: hypothetical protein Q7R80_03315 [bacterium]|nr:hypothetical protein [bacterium]
MAFIVPRFRRESWYGRLYLRAYGEDRGWLVRLKRMTFSTGFEYAPYPTLTGDMSEAEQLMTLCNWRRGREEARERCPALLMAPPFVQPFVETGPRVSICPTFWKIVFALFVYCPLVALRAAWRASVSALRTTFAAIASAFRWTGRRFGRPLAWTGATAVALTSYVALLYGIGWSSYFFSGKLEDRQGISHLEAFAQDQAAKSEVEREQLRQDYLAVCVRRIREDVEWMEGRTAIPDVDCSGADYRPPHITHEEYARQCVGHDEAHLAAIEAVERGSLDCARGWSNWEFTRLSPGKAERDALATWIAGGLRKQFAAELKTEIPARERRIAEARKRDVEVVGAATVELLPLAQDPRAFYERFHEMCDFVSYNGTTWIARSRFSDGMTNATCATLAGLFGKEIDTAQSAIQWAGIKTSTRAAAPKFGIGIGALLGSVLLIFAIIAFLKRYGQPFLRGLEWFFERVLGPGLMWTVIIVTAPIWVPVRYLIWPVLCLIGRSFRSVGLAFWNIWLLRMVRSAFVSVFTGIASGIRRFAVATRQVLADTWHLLRAFASAKWERLCPFIEWN